MNARFAERIREAQETIEVLRTVHPANHPDVTQIAEFFELHAAHERKHGRTENAERAAQRPARLRENPSRARARSAYALVAAIGQQLARQGVPRVPAAAARWW